MNPRRYSPVMVNIWLSEEGRPAPRSVQIGSVNTNTMKSHRTARIKDIPIDVEYILVQPFTSPLPMVSPITTCTPTDIIVPSEVNNISNGFARP